MNTNNKKEKLTKKCGWHEECDRKAYLARDEESGDEFYFCPLHYLNSMGDELMGDLRDQMSSQKGTNEARNIVREWLLKMESEYELYKIKGKK